MSDAHAATRGLPVQTYMRISRTVLTLWVALEAEVVVRCAGGCEMRTRRAAIPGALRPVREAHFFADSFMEVRESR